MGNLKSNLDHSQQNHENAKMKIHDIQSKIRECERSLKETQKQGNNRLVLFGDKMPRLVHEILTNKGKFSKMPIGPLGMEIQLKNNVSKTQAALIENELGRTLCKFKRDILIQF